VRTSEDLAASATYPDVLPRHGPPDVATPTGAAAIACLPATRSRPGWGICYGPWSRGLTHLPIAGDLPAAVGGEPVEKSGHLSRACRSVAAFGGILAASDTGAFLVRAACRGVDRSW